jgi:methylenetetrahydrofolate dehydrogenase (NADP+)/methenyltetrahydrofolate cyclohydrolase
MKEDPGARLMDGAALARRLVAETARRAERFGRLVGRPPSLAAVLVGSDPASVTYAKMKQARCRTGGLTSRLVCLPADSTTTQAVAAVAGLSGDPAVDGILVQHPVPDHVDERAVFEAIAPTKDVDGVTMHSFAAMAFGLPGLATCTPAGIIRLLDEYAVDPAGKHAVVLGRSPIVGKPVGMLLLSRDATVTLCHSHTRHLPELIGSADIVVAAVGQPGLVRGDWLKAGAVVIDAGYGAGNAGDVVFAEARQRASLITPVPGGVGPMTIAMLLEQTVTAAEAIWLAGEDDRSEHGRHRRGRVQ